MKASNSNLPVVRALQIPQNGFTSETLELAEEAEQYVQAHRWCKCVLRVRLFQDWDGVLGLFQVDIEPATPSADTSCWVIVGDVPPAYIDIPSAPTAHDAMSAYLANLSAWVSAVREGKSTDDLMPVQYRGSIRFIEPSDQYVEELASRVNFIARNILPSLLDE